MQKIALPIVAISAAMLLTNCFQQDCSKFFEGINPTTSCFKPQSEHNPIAIQRFGADPYAMEYNGRVYVYMTNDVLEYDEIGFVKENSYQTINKIFCVSSDDMVNWTDHGAMPIAGPEGAAKWAQFSWAPTACHKTIDGKEKFFLYFANSGNGIGVVTSDTPYGPWTDPIGGPLVSRETPTCAEVTWLFDPAILVDDNGDGYLYVGGGVPEVKGKPQFADPGTARVVKLDESFVALDGKPVTIRPPYLFEDAGANKIGDTYYYSYCTNFNSPELGNGCIAYMTSKKPMGPFTFQRVFFKNPETFFGVGGNNHHAIIKFNDRYYLFYHAQTLQTALGISGGYRSTHVDEVNIDENGVIQDVTGTLTGVDQIKNLDPFQTVEAETMAWTGFSECDHSSLITTEYADSTNNLVVKTQAGDWIGLSKVDFADGATTFTARITESVPTAAIKICLDSINGKCIGYVPAPISHNENISISVEINGKEFKPAENTSKIQLTEKVTSVHDLFFIFSDYMAFDSWSFGK